jgi:hypothetical protein
MKQGNAPSYTWPVLFEQACYRPMGEGLETLPKIHHDAVVRHVGKLIHTASKNDLKNNQRLHKIGMKALGPHLLWIILCIGSFDCTEWPELTVYRFTMPTF